MAWPRGMDESENGGGGADVGSCDVDGSGSSHQPQRQQDDEKRPVFVTNNFDNYMKLRRGKNETEINHSNRREEKWNHFTAPLDPTREPSSAALDDSDRSAAKPKHSVPSAFTDMERSQTVDRFANIFMDRMGNVMSSGKLGQAWQGGGGGSVFSWLLLSDHSPGSERNRSRGLNPDDYAAERNMMQPHFTPVVWGSGCMIVTLFSLRFGRWYQGRNLGGTIGNVGSGAGSGSGSRTTGNVKSLQDARHAKQQQTYNSNSESPFNPRNQLKKEAMSSLQTLPVDMALSMLVGISTTVFLTRPHYLMKDFSNAPLLEGKSVLAEELCLPFREEMANVNSMNHTYTPYSKENDMPSQRQVVPYSDLWKEENAGDFDSLRAIRDFVANCQEREKVARRVLEEDGVGDVSEQELMEVRMPRRDSLADIVE